MKKIILIIAVMTIIFGLVMYLNYSYHKRKIDQMRLDFNSLCELSIDSIYAIELFKYEQSKNEYEVFDDVVEKHFPKLNEYQRLNYRIIGDSIHFYYKVNWIEQKISNSYPSIFNINKGNILTLKPFEKKKHRTACYMKNDSLFLLKEDTILLSEIQNVIFQAQNHYYDYVRFNNHYFDNCYVLSRFSLSHTSNCLNLYCPDTVVNNYYYNRYMDFLKCNLAFLMKKNNVSKLQILCEIPENCVTIPLRYDLRKYPPSIPRE